MECTRFKLVRYYHNLVIVCNAHSKYVLGRGNPNVQILDALCPIISCPSRCVSARHCEIFTDDQGFWHIKDLKSKNGTYLNSKRLKENHVRELREGDKIGIGINVKDDREYEKFDVSSPSVYIFEFTALDDKDENKLLIPSFSTMSTRASGKKSSSSFTSSRKRKEGSGSYYLSGAGVFANPGSSKINDLSIIETPKIRVETLPSVSSEDDSSDGLTDLRSDVAPLKRTKTPNTCSTSIGKKELPEKRIVSALRKHRTSSAGRSSIQGRVRDSKNSDVFKGKGSIADSDNEVSDKDRELNSEKTVEPTKYSDFKNDEEKVRHSDSDNENEDEEGNGDNNKGVIIGPQYSKRRGSVDCNDQLDDSINLSSDDEISVIEIINEDKNDVEYIGSHIRKENTKIDIVDVEKSDEDDVITPSSKEKRRKVKPRDRDKSIKVRGKSFKKSLQVLSKERQEFKHCRLSPIAGCSKSDETSKNTIMANTVKNWDIESPRKALNDNVSEFRQMAIVNVAKSVPTKVPKLNEDTIYTNICSWSVLWNEDKMEGEPCEPADRFSIEVENVLEEYESWTVYQKTLYPLILHEIGSIINKEAEESKKPGYKGFESHMAVDSWDLTYMCPLTPSNSSTPVQGRWVNIRCHSFANYKEEIPENFDICMIKYSIKLKQERIKKTRGEGDNIHPVATLAFVVPNSFVWEPIHDSEFNLKYFVNVTFYIQDPDGFQIHIKDPVKFKRISCISDKLSSYRALTYLPQFPICTNILEPPKINNPWCFQANIRYDSLVPHCKTLNPRQRSITDYVSKRIMRQDGPPEIMLINGAPGTGKTKTIVGIIMQLVTSQDFRTAAPNILVCAPSSVAVDVLVSRLREVLGTIEEESRPLMIRIQKPGEVISSIGYQYTPEFIAKRKLHKDASYIAIDSAIRNVTHELKDQMTVEAELMMNERDKTQDIHLKSIQRRIEGLRARESELERSYKLATKAGDQEKIKRIMNDTIKAARIVCSTMEFHASAQIDLENAFQVITKSKEATRHLPMFTCCIVDEATQTTEVESLSPLIFNLEKLVLVGDPMQLTAKVVSNEAKKCHYGRSLFLRLYNNYQTCKPSPVMHLKEQYRTHEEILKWPNRRYYDGELVTKPIRKSSVVECPVPPYLLFNCTNLDLSESCDLSQDDEIFMLVELLKSIWTKLCCLNSAFSIGVIVPYTKFKPLLIIKLGKFPELLNILEVDTVEKFQGREKDIIILSCVRAEALDVICKNNLNVALTRAIHSLLIIGNTESLNSNSEWKNLIEDAESRKLLHSISSAKMKQPGYMAKFLRNILESVDASEIPEESRKRNRL